MKRRRTLLACDPSASFRQTAPAIPAKTQHGRLLRLRVGEGNATNRFSTKVTTFTHTDIRSAL